MDGVGGGFGLGGLGGGFVGLVGGSVGWVSSAWLNGVE